MSSSLSSPLSDSVFSGFSLDPRLMQALQKAAFEEPTPVQNAAIPVALTGKDLLVGAETGSGKTAAFVLPMLNRLLEKSAESGRVDNTGTRALILVPTRELAIQVVKQCDLLASCSHLKTGLIIGGNSFKYQQAMFRKNPEIIVATPGRMAEHIGHGSTDLKDIEVLVLDEADRMLDLGLGADVIKIANNCNKPRQTMLFSATLTHKAFSAITQDILNNPEIIKLNSVREKHSNIVQQIILADDRDHKDRLLDGLFAEQTFEKALIFCNTRAQATRLCGLLRYRASGADKLRSGLLHGDMSQDERKDTVNKLRGGNINIVVATDVAARGLDIKGIDIVINYDMPRNGTDYTHRIGRTGRAGEEGLAVSLISAFEWNLMSSIERYLRVRFDHRKIKGLEAKYKGPKKVKASGKAAGTKKKKSKNADDKGKGRHRDKKNIGKRRAVAKKTDDGRSKEGHSPLKKKLLPKVTTERKNTDKE